MIRHIIESHRIFEATDPGEWNQLSDANKAKYALVISLTGINMADESLAKAVLWSLFGENSTTRANLEALLRPEPEPEEE